MKVFRSHLLLCGGTGCHASGSLEVKKALLAELDKRGLAGEIKVVETGCNGFCAMGPVMVVYPEGVMYMMVQAGDIPELVEEHLLKGRVLERLLYKEPVTGKVIPTMQEIPFFALQDLRVLRNRGIIDPEKIEEYIARDGYVGMAKALTEMTSEEIIKAVMDSGLRGRGGAGFPTGLKWRFASQSPGDIKYVLCNADEGDPGAFMDRSVLEADPHAVLEGMIIAAKAIGSHQGYIYCRAEYPLAIHRLNIAIDQAKEAGLLGRDILGTGFDFELEIYQGAGAFVCGEETALMTSIEGKRGMPRPRPPFPAISGLWQRPSILNNVETLANIGQIILRSAAWYAGVGTTRSKGTKVFALTGDVNNIGLVEVPMGTPLGTIVYDIGGGIAKGKKFKAAQLGGPSGGMIPIQHLNAPVDYEKVAELGAIMGSGGLIVMNEDSCAVDMARFFMDFCKDESCGKCTPCRAGTQKMLEILTNICNGKGKEGDIEKLEKWANVIKNTALCGLGQTAPNPVLSTLRYFRKEYEAHIRENRCPAVVCSAFFKTPCMHACPINMDIPSYLALIKADRLEDAYKVLLKTNPFPSICGRVCDHKCETKCRRSTVDEAVGIKYLKRYITDNAARPGQEKAPVTRNEKIAVIGAGPSGLTAARDLALRGYAVTLFDEYAEAGGMLRWGIPAYRLPREILDREIADILSLGIEFRNNTKVGMDVSWDEIRIAYTAVYLAIGAQRSARSGVEGDGLKGVEGAIEFLREVNLGRKPKVGKRIAVVGGGNSAVDAARSALRLGAETVTIVYRRLREDMPAQDVEIHAAEAEGMKIEYLAAPIRFQGADGRLQSVICQRMTLGEFDASGRKKPVPLIGSEFTLEADQVILAIGQEAVFPFDVSQAGIGVTKRKLIEVVKGSKTATAVAMVFAGGDAVTGPDTVVGAVAAGHHAAAEIDAAVRLRNGEAPYVPVEEEIAIPMVVDEETQEIPRVCIPEVACLERIKDFREVELGLSKEAALTEASRCLRCDIQIE